MVLLGDLGEGTGFGEGDGEGLVDDDVLSGAESGCCEGEVALVGGGDDDEVDVGMGGDVSGSADDGAGDAGVDGFGFAGADDGEGQAGYGLEEGGVDGFSGVAVADEAYSEGVLGGVYCLHLTMVAGGSCVSSSKVLCGVE